MPGLKDQLHLQWSNALGEKVSLLDEIEKDLPEVVFPPKEHVLKSLSYPLDKASVVIIGQDPYPTKGTAMGLAFSVSSDIKKLPASLRNIFAELSNDLGGEERINGDLSSWSEQGVVLLNRSLTFDPSLKKIDPRWRNFTDEVARVLGSRDIVAILWGSNAQQLAHYFNPRLTISSSHPSPLSAYRGFFGSKPFSRTNTLLKEIGREPINWN